MFNTNNSISINVSDEDSDNHAEKLRVRARRKRKKSTPRGTAKSLYRFLRRWWPLFLFFPAAGLLVFEASSLGHKHSPLINSEVATQKTHDSVTEKKPQGNLNRLDPTTRVVAGVRERKYFNYCSDLLYYSFVLYFVILCIACILLLILMCICICLNRGKSVIPIAKTMIWLRLV